VGPENNGSDRVEGLPDGVGRDKIKPWSFRGDGRHLRFLHGWRLEGVAVAWSSAGDAGPNARLRFGARSAFTVGA